MITASSLTNGPIEHSSISASSSEPSISHLIANLIYYVAIGSSEQEIWDWERKIQQRLNLREQISCEDQDLLKEVGYTISHRAETVDRFKNYKFIQCPELAQAIREASPDGGLLLDKYRAYHPGPASVKCVGGVAKGYGEIIEISKMYKKDLRFVRHAINRSIMTLYDNSVSEDLWKEAITILDFSSDNTVHSRPLLEVLKNRLPDGTSRVISIDLQAGGSTSSQEQIVVSSDTPRPAQFYMPDFLDSLPRELKGQAQVIVMSQPNITKDQTDDFFDRIKAWQGGNTLLIFLNEKREIPKHADNYRHHITLNENPTKSKDVDFISAMNAAGYATKVIIEENQLKFPPLDRSIEDQIINLEFSDYENPHANCSEEFKNVKALIEYLSGIPLEAMSVQERKQYLETLKRKFDGNGGPFLKIVYEITIACHHHNDRLFQQAFKEMDKAWCNFEESYQRAANRVACGYYQSAKYHLIQAMKYVQYQLNANKFTVASHSEASDHLNQQLSQGFELLAEIFLKQGHYPQAAGLLWYTKRLRGHQKKEDPITLLHLNDNKRVFPNQEKSPFFTIDRTVKSLSNRIRLSEIRHVIKQKLEKIKKITSPTEKATALRKLFRNIEKEVKKFIAHIVKECESELAQTGKLPPCEYAIVRVDPLADEITPYSTLKIAILSDNNEDHPYFRDLLVLIHLKMINIGETALSMLNIPELSWMDDTITPHGLSIDPNIFHNDLCSKNLTSMEYIVGSPSGNTLTARYENRFNESQIKGERKARAIKLMEQEIESLIPRIEVEGTGKVQQIERDLYESVNNMLDRLADYYSLRSKSNLDRIEELEGREILTSTGAQDLKELVLFYRGFRLFFHLANEKKKINVEDIENTESEAIIFDLYYRAIPFYEAMKQFYTLIKNGKSGLEALHKERFFSPDHHTQGLTAHRLMKYRQADAAFSQVYDRTPQYLEQFGDIKRILGQYHEAVNLYQEAIALHADPFHLAHLYKKKGDMLKELAQFNEDKTGAGAAYTESIKIILKLVREKKNLLYLGEQWCMIYQSISKETFDTIEIEIENLQKMLEEVYRAQSNLEKQKANFHKAKEFLQLAKDVTKERNTGMQNDPIIQIPSDLSLLENIDLEINITQEIDADLIKLEQLQNEGGQILTSIFHWCELPQSTMNIVSLDRLLENLIFMEEFSNYLKRTLAVRRAAYGTNHPYIASTLEKIGEALAKQGNHDAAVEYHEEAKNIRMKIFGKLHPAVAQSSELLGEVFSALSSHDEAQGHHQEALNIRQELFGKCHPLVAQSLETIGIALGKLERHLEALQLKKQALNIRQKIYGTLHPEVAINLRNLSITLCHLGKDQEALTSQKQSLNILQKIFVNHHPFVADLQKSIAFTLCSIKREKEALTYMQLCLENLQKIYGQDHPEVIAIKLSLVWILEGLNQSKDALKHNQDALTSCIKTYGKKHPEVLKCYNNLGIVLGTLKRYHEALQYKRKSLKLSKQLFGNDDPKIAKCMNNVGTAWEILGHHKKALKYQQMALEIWNNYPPDFRYEIGISLYNAGNAHVNLGDYQNALLDYQGATHSFSSDLEKRNPLEAHIQALIPLCKEMITALGLLSEKKYDHLYQHLIQIEKRHKIITSDFSCWLFVAALLAKKKTELQEQLDYLVEIGKKSEEPGYPLRRLNINCVLGYYYLQQQQFSKAITYGNLLTQAQPQMLFTYRAIEAAGMGESPAVIGEQISFKILGHYYVLQAKERLQATQPQASSSSDRFDDIEEMHELLECFENNSWTGHKANEIKAYVQGRVRQSFN